MYSCFFLLLLCNASNPGRICTKKVAIKIINNHAVLTTMLDSEQKDLPLVLSSESEVPGEIISLVEQPETQIVRSRVIRKKPISTGRLFLKLTYAVLMATSLGLNGYFFVNLPAIKLVQSLDAMEKERLEQYRELAQSFEAMLEEMSEQKIVNAKLVTQEEKLRTTIMQLRKEEESMRVNLSGIERDISDKLALKNNSTVRDYYLHSEMWESATFVMGLSMVVWGSIIICAAKVVDWSVGVTNTTRAAVETSLEVADTPKSSAPRKKTVRWASETRFDRLCGGQGSWRNSMPEPQEASKPDSEDDSLSNDADSEQDSLLDFRQLDPEPRYFPVTTESTASASGLNRSTRPRHSPHDLNNNQLPRTHHRKNSPVQELEQAEPRVQS